MDKIKYYVVYANDRNEICGQFVVREDRIKTEQDIRDITEEIMQVKGEEVVVPITWHILQS
jgi:hypothetical protein